MTLEAQINPGGLETTYEVWVGRYPECIEERVESCESSGNGPAGTGVIVGTIPASFSSHTVSVDIAKAWHKLSPNSSYIYNVRATNSGWAYEGSAYGEQKVFSTASASAPAIESESVSNITPTDATLQAQINPEGLETTYEVWVGALPCVIELGGPERCEEDKVAGTIPAGFSAAQVSIDIAKASHQLKPNSAYLYSFRATNMDGTTYASNKEFKTAAAAAPSIESESVPHLTPTDATLEAQINTEGLATSYEFYLQEAPLCFKANPPCERPQHEPLTLAGGKLFGSFVTQSVSAELNSAGVSLSAGEHYEYWVTATSLAGTTTGPAQEFQRTGRNGAAAEHHNPV